MTAVGSFQGENGAKRAKTEQQVRGPLMSAPNERRRHPRVALRWAIALTRLGEQARVASVTENLSRAGFYCFSSEPFRIGETVDCVLEIPTRDLGYPSSPLSLRCRAQVVRLEHRESESRFGVACRIDDYEIAADALK